VLQCTEHADAQKTAGLKIPAGFVIWHAGPQYVNQLGNAKDLNDVCRVVTCALPGCLFPDVSTDHHVMTSVKLPTSRHHDLKMTPKLCCFHATRMVLCSMSA